MFVNDWKSVYRHCYRGERAEIPDKAKWTPDYPESGFLSGPYEEHLLTEKYISKKEHPTQYEAPKPGYKRMLEKRPTIINFIPEEINEDIINKEIYDRTNKTIYQINYCQPGKPKPAQCIKNDLLLPDYPFISEKTLGRRRINLPEDWGEFPVTTQSAGYRDLRKLATWDLKPKATKPPSQSLKPNLKEREILKVSTGFSEYQGKIGALGNEIICEHLHGKVIDSEACPLWEKVRKQLESLPLEVKPPYAT